MFAKKFGDPVAGATAWVGMGPAYTFVSHCLVHVDEARWELRPRGRTYVSHVLSLLIAIAAISTPLLRPMPRPRFTLLAGVAFLAMTLYRYRREMSYAVFDFERGQLARVFRSRPLNAQEPGGVPIDEVHALQLLHLKVVSSDGTFDTSELNAVTRSGTRVHLESHAKTELIRADAQTLATKLRIPIWEHRVKSKAQKKPQRRWLR